MLKNNLLTVNREVPLLPKAELKPGSNWSYAKAGPGESSLISNGEYLKSLVRLLITRDECKRDIDQFVGDLRRAERDMLKMIGDQGQSVKILKEILGEIDSRSRVGSVI